ncbi:hypothetical protein KCU90_g5407, partial [Aureobasidium melanogenum]
MSVGNGNPAARNRCSAARRAGESGVGRIHGEPTRSDKCVTPAGSGPYPLPTTTHNDSSNNASCVNGKALAIGNSRSGKRPTTMSRSPVASAGNRWAVVPSRTVTRTFGVRAFNMPIAAGNSRADAEINVPTITCPLVPSRKSLSSSVI